METRRRYRAPAADAFAALMQRRSLAGFLCEPMPPLQVHDLYLDTEAAELLAQGLLLRLREHGGLVSASLRPAEVEAGEDIAQARFREGLPQHDDPVTLPEGSLREAVAARTEDRPLRPILRFRQYRTPRALYDGDRLAGVLSLDVVSDESEPGAEPTITNEVEVELVRGGRPSDLARLDEDLRGLGFEPEPFAKFEAGLIRRSRGEQAPLYLLPRERADLEARRESESAVERRRAEVILLAAEGADTRTISREVSLSPSRVRHWRHAFRHERMRVFDADAPEPTFGEVEEPPVRTFQVTEVLGVEPEPKRSTPSWPPADASAPPDDPLAQEAPVEKAPEPEEAREDAWEPVFEAPEEPDRTEAEGEEEGAQAGGYQGRAGEGRGAEPTAHPPFDMSPFDTTSPFDPSVEEMLGQVLRAVEDRVREGEALGNAENLPDEPPVLAPVEAAEDPSSGEAPPSEPAPDTGFVGDAWFEVDAPPPDEAEVPAMETPPPDARSAAQPDALPPRLPLPQAAARALKRVAEGLRSQAPLSAETAPEGVRAAREELSHLRALLDLFEEVLPERDARRLLRDLEGVHQTLATAEALDHAAASAHPPEGSDREAVRLPFALAQTVWGVERRRLLETSDLLAPLADRVDSLAGAVSQDEALDSASGAAIRLCHRLPSALWHRYEALRVFEEPLSGSAALPLVSIAGPLGTFAEALRLTEGGGDVLTTVDRVRTTLRDHLAAGVLEGRLGQFADEWVRPGGAADPAPLEARRDGAREEARKAAERLRPLWEALMSPRFREALGRVTASL